MPADLPMLTLADAAAWSRWLGRSADTSRGVWLTLAKKGTTTPTSLTYAQRYTPRTAKSTWSQRNVAHVARLEAQGGRMTARGWRAVEAARADGRWDAAYAGSAAVASGTGTGAEQLLPPEFLAAVAGVPDAQAMWEVLTSRNRFAIYHRLHALKTQAGRERRVAAFVDMLARGETPYPQKQKAEPKSKSKSKSKFTPKSDSDSNLNSKQERPVANPIPIENE
ncbi:hypothetical protein SLS62_010023 [Diatrype stigma]|uniref:Uncharacterized protein n=1 Tax=Diatrype stigma TaxID=117547 RepID=A0AAN9UEA2_9PEZI